MEVGNSKCLLKKNLMFFNILSTVHKNTGHGGHNKMMYTLKDKYFIPKPVVLYL